MALKTPQALLGTWLDESVAERVAEPPQLGIEGMRGIVNDSFQLEKSQNIILTMLCGFSRCV